MFSSIYLKDLNVFGAPHHHLVHHGSVMKNNGDYEGPESFTKIYKRYIQRKGKGEFKYYGS